jgi:hypothetical protein
MAISLVRKIFAQYKGIAYRLLPDAAKYFFCDDKEIT